MKENKLNRVGELLTHFKSNEDLRSDELLKGLHEAWMEKEGKTAEDIGGMGLNW